MDEQAAANKIVQRAKQKLAKRHTVRSLAEKALAHSGEPGSARSRGHGAPLWAPFAYFPSIALYSEPVAPAASCRVS